MDRWLAIAAQKNRQPEGNKWILFSIQQTWVYLMSFWLLVQLQVTLAIGGGLYPLRPLRLTIFSWRVIACHLLMCPNSGKAGQDHKCWLASVHQENIANFAKLNRVFMNDEFDTTQGIMLCLIKQTC